MPARHPESFMSGYSDHAALREQVLRAGVNFIQKPFAPSAIGKRIREVLDTPRGL